MMMMMMMTTNVTCKRFDSSPHQRSRRGVDVAQRVERRQRVDDGATHGFVVVMTTVWDET